MLDLRFLVQNTAQVEEALKKRGGGAAWLPLVQELVALDKKRREHLQLVEALKSQRNNASQEIATIKKAKGDASAIMEQMKAVSHKIKEGDEGVALIEADITRLLFEIPNTPDAVVPAGKEAADN